MAITEFYLPLRLVHIISATILYGSIAITLFLLWRAHRSDDLGLMAGVARFIVLANWVLVLPAFIIQPATGAVLVYAAGYDSFDGWIAVALSVFAIVLALWGTIFRLQVKIRNLTEGTLYNDVPLVGYRKSAMLCLWLHWPLIFILTVIFWLMIFRPELGAA